MQIELDFLGLEKMFTFSLVKKRMNAIKSQITPLEIWGEELCHYTEQKVLSWNQVENDLRLKDKS